MEQWKGIEDAETIVGAGAPTVAVGTSFFVEGELRRRPGLTALALNGAVSLATFTDATGIVWLVLVTPSGNIVAYNMASPSTSVTIGTGYDVTNPPNTLAVNGRLYITNGFSPMLVWDGVRSAASAAGIAAPAAAPGSPSTAAGNTTTGVHLVRYRYIDSTSPGSVYRSNASPVLSVTVTAGNQQLTFTVGSQLTASSDTKCDTIQLEMTTASGSVYYVVGTCANTASATIVANVADTVLSQNSLGGTYDSGPSGTDLGIGNDQPPIAAVLGQVLTQTFLGGDNPRTVTVTATNGLTTISGTGFSTSWGSDRVIRVGTDSRAYQIASATSTVITLTQAYAGTTQTTSALVYAKNPNRIYWSSTAAAMPESWRITARARDVLNGTGDVLRGLVEYLGCLLIVGRFTLQQLIFNLDPATGTLSTLPGKFGCWNQRCLVTVEGMVYGWGPNGAWLCYNGWPRWISRNIDRTVGALVNSALASQFHAAYDPTEKVVTWWYVALGETLVRKSISYDLTAHRWRRDDFRQGIDASLTLGLSSGLLQRIVSDKTNGLTWYNVGATDGVPSSSTGSYTGSTGNTTTVTNVTQSLPTGTLTSLKGCILYRPSTGEEVAITSNTASAITHAALATPVANGEAIYVGSIPWQWTTPWWIGDGQQTAKRPHLWIKLAPSTVSGTLTVRFYADQIYVASPTPVTFVNNTGYTPPSGVTFGSDGTSLVVDISTATNDGFVQLPMPLDWCRAMQAQVTCSNPSGTLIVLGITWSLFRPGDQLEKVVVR